jgi:hypothetical protein
MHKRGGWSTEVAERKRLKAVSAGFPLSPVRSLVVSQRHETRVSQITVRRPFTEVRLRL